MLAKFGRAVAALALTLGLAACASSSPTVQAPPPPPQPVVEAAPQPVAPPPAITKPQDGRIRVALLLPLSGRGQQVGQSMLDAAQLAVFELADDKFLLMPRDTKGSAQDAAAAAQAAINDGAQLILGPLFSPEAAGIKPVAAAAGVPVLSFSSDWAVAGGGLWTLGFQPQDQVQRVVAYAAAQGLTRFGILAPATPYGQAVIESMTGAVQQAGGQITRIERYTPGGDSTAVVKRLSDFEQRKAAAHGGKEAAEPPFQAVMIAEGGQQLRALASLFPFFDLDPGPVRLLGTGLWDEQGLGREPALVGGWFAAPAPEARQPFEGRFQELYGYKPHRLATLAYDAAALAAVLARQGGPQPFTPAALTNPNGFSGIDGIFRLLPSGLPERGLSVLEVTRTGTSVVDQAPTTFQPQAF
ncbi:penicillin-binding protein activator [Oleisolibacter albus]|uniref:penicillin-binding protein activator n=1 Tax=Oleisolibacter albus TaxID=2171757 RepID=UPI000DF31760|nr:penicillin-binding protein activator [Oleisolibacter albus]